MGDATLSRVEEKIILRKTSSVDADDRDDESNSVNHIPTAIVKPKYQKLSFDERQLPIRGATDAESDLWNCASNSSTTTITTTPRKVQKHLPKSQKSFSKHSRKLVNVRSAESETCSSNYDVLDKATAIHEQRKDFDIDSGVIQMQNSVAIVQPIKKVIDANITFDVEKIEKQIERSKNSAMSQKAAELKYRKSSKTNTANETAAAPKVMNDCGKNANNNNYNLNNNIGNRKYFEREKNVATATVSKESDKKVPTKIHKDNSGELINFHSLTSLSLNSVPTTKIP